MDGGEVSIVIRVGANNDFDRSERLNFTSKCTSLTKS
jgi:hypothetical protein